MIINSEGNTACRSYRAFLILKQKELSSFFCWEPTQLHYIFFSSITVDDKADMYLNKFVSYVLLSVAVPSASS